MVTPKIRTLKRNQIDDTKWNLTIREAVNSLPYAYTWYLDALCTKWIALVVGDYDFVMPLPVGRKWGLLYVYQPLFCQQLGVFYRMRSDTIIDLMLNTALKKFVFVNLNGNYDNHTLTFDKKRLTQKKNLVLKLSEKHKTIQANYNENTLRNIKKAKKAGIIFEEADVRSIPLFTDFYVKHVAFKDATFKPKNIQSLKRLAEQMVIHSCGRMYVAKTSGGQMCAGVVVVESENRIIHLIPASDEYARRTGAMHLLVNQILDHYQSSGMLYDFEGSSTESIARFYEGFGAVNEPFFLLSKTPFR